MVDMRPRAKKRRPLFSNSPPKQRLRTAKCNPRLPGWKASFLLVQHLAEQQKGVQGGSGSRPGKALRLQNSR